MKIVNNEHDTEYWMRVFGHKRLLDGLIDDAPTLETRGMLSATKDGRCHTEAHFLGRMAYKVDGLTLKDESDMDTRCQFGFYHGVIEASLGNAGDDGVIKELAAQCKQYDDDAIRRFFCQHIIGHGIMLYNDYDLPEAVKKCHDLLSSEIERKICYHGVFMENAFAAIQISAPGHETEWVNPKRPDFPCDSPRLPDFPHVQEECYQNQSILWAQQPITNFDEQKAFEGCLRAPPEVRSMCFGGVGFNIVLLTTSLNSDEVIMKCKKAPTPEDQRECLVGALFLRNSPVWQTLGFRNEAFCSALGKPNLFKCDTYVSNILSWLFDPAESDKETTQ